MRSRIDPWVRNHVCWVRTTQLSKFRLPDPTRLSGAVPGNPGCSVCTEEMPRNHNILIKSPHSHESFTRIMNFLLLQLQVKNYFMNVYIHFNIVGKWMAAASNEGGE